jgi:hypothetical protein
MGTWGSFPGIKAAGGVNLTTYIHLMPRSKNEWSYTSTFTSTFTYGAYKFDWGKNKNPDPMKKTVYLSEETP